MYTIAPAQHEQTTSRGVARYEMHSARLPHIANKFTTTGAQNTNRSWNLGILKSGEGAKPRSRRETQRGGTRTAVRVPPHLWYRAQAVTHGQRGGEHSRQAMPLNSPR